MARSQIVENLQVQLGASIDKALGQTLARWERQNQDAAQRAAGAFKQFDGAVAKAQSTLLSFRNLAVAGVVVGFGALVNRTISAVDAMDDAAAAAGLNVERYQELRFASQFAGVSQEEFASAMSRFAKVAGEAAQGGDAALQSFRELDIEVRDGNGILKSQEQLLNEAIKAIGGYANQSERAAAAAGLFGREAGPKFAAFMAQGEQGINNLVERARELGLILSEETVRAAVSARDKLDLLGDVIQTKLTVAIVEAAPLLEQLVGYFIDLVEWASRAAGAVPGTVEGIRRELDDLAAKRDAPPDLLQRMFGQPAPERRLSAAERERQALLQARLGELLGEPPGYPGGAAPSAMSRTQRFSPSDLAGRERFLSAAVSGMGRALETAEREAEAWERKRAELHDAGMEHMLSNLERESQAEAAQLARRLEAIAGFERQKAEVRKAYEQAVDELDRERIDKEQRAAEAAAEAWGNALRGITQSFDVLFDKTLSGWEKVGKVALDVIERIAVAAATQLGGGQDPYKQAGGWLAGVFGGLFGGGSKLPAGGAHGGLVPRTPEMPSGGIFGSGGIFDFGMFAEGGPVGAGRPIIVGEKGPEIFKPRVAGEIIPNHALGGGGVTVVQQFTFNAATDARSVDEAMRRWAPTIAARAKAGVMDDMARNRGLAKQVR